MTSIQYKFWVSLVLWNHNMENTADLAMVQKTIIDNLHKEGKSQRVITEGVAVHKVLYQSKLNAKLIGRKKLGKKMCTSNRDDRKLENTVKQSRFKHLGELHKEWTEAGVSGSRVTTLRHLQEKSYQATSETETTSEASVAQWSRVLFSDESKFCISFGNQGSQSLEVEWRDTECLLLEVQCEVSTVIDDFECHVICWCWPTVFSEVHSQHSHLPGHFRVLHASFCWKNFMEMLISCSSRTWAPAHTAQRYQSWLNDHGVTVRDWASKLAWPHI